MSILSTNEYIQIIFARAFGAHMSNKNIFPAMSFKIYKIFTQKLYLGKEITCKWYFIYTLFRGKSYFIWRKIILYLEIYHWQHWFLHWFHRKTWNQNVYNIHWPCRVGLVASVSDSHAVGCGFTSQPGHTKDLHKYGRNCLPSLQACVRVGVWQCSLTVNSVDQPKSGIVSRSRISISCYMAFAANKAL